MDRITYKNNSNLWKAFLNALKKNIYNSTHNINQHNAPTNSLSIQEALVLNIETILKNIKNDSYETAKAYVEIAAHVFHHFQTERNSNFEIDDNTLRITRCGINEATKILSDHLNSDKTNSKDDNEFSLNLNKAKELLIFFDIIEEFNSKIEFNVSFKSLSMMSKEELEEKCNSLELQLEKAIINRFIKNLIIANPTEEADKLDKDFSLNQQQFNDLVAELKKIEIKAFEKLSNLSYFMCEFQGKLSADPSKNPIANKIIYEQARLYFNKASLIFKDPNYRRKSLKIMLEASKILSQNLDEGLQEDLLELIMVVIENPKEHLILLKTAEFRFKRILKNQSLSIPQNNPPEKCFLELNLVRAIIKLSLNYHSAPNLHTNKYLDFEIQVGDSQYKGIKKLLQI